MYAPVASSGRSGPATIGSRGKDVSQPHKIKALTGNTGITMHIKKTIYIYILYTGYKICLTLIKLQQN